jgi:hypothetical protein
VQLPKPSVITLPDLAQLKPKKNGQSGGTYNLSTALGTEEYAQRYICVYQILPMRNQQDFRVLIDLVVF